VLRNTKNKPFNFAGCLPRDPVFVDQPIPPMSKNAIANYTLKIPLSSDTKLSRLLFPDKITGFDLINRLND